MFPLQPLKLCPWPAFTTTPLPTSAVSSFAIALHCVLICSAPQNFGARSVRFWDAFYFLLPRTPPPILHGNVTSRNIVLLPCLRKFLATYHLPSHHQAYCSDHYVYKILARGVAAKTLRCKLASRLAIGFNVSSDPLDAKYLVL